MRLRLLVEGAVIALVTLIGFLLIADIVWVGAVDGLDDEILTWVARHRTEDLNELFISVTALGASVVLVPVAVGIAGALWLGRRPGMAIAVLTALSGGWALSSGTKALVERARPTVAPRLEDAGGYAFPSGHTMNAVAFFVTLALLVAGHVERRALRIYLVAYALLLGGLVALSRVYLGVHYPSDVVAAVLLAVTWSVAVVAGERVLRHRASISTGGKR